jgi:hemerythrin-like domain-containing protein
MKATKILRTDQELINRFLAAFGLGLVYAAQNKPVKASFFIYACNFIKGYIEGSYFKKEEVLLKSLEDNGLTSNSGPLYQMFNELKQSQQMSDEILAAARQWQSGETESRNSTVWATSNYTSLLRQHIERSRSIIFPLAEQLIPPDDQYKIAEALNQIVFEGDENQTPEQYEKMIVALKEEADEFK